jgi:tetratricopeptide (TPR) repeat protein
LGNGRFSMLETVHEYALERLEELSSSQEIHRRHAVFFLHVAGSANLSAGRMPTGSSGVAIAMEERDNLRAALAWTLASGAIELGFELATALEMLWATQNPHEGMRWFNALFAHPAAATVAPSSRAHALRAYGSSTDLAGDDAGAEQLYQQSLRLFEALGDASGRAVLLHRLGIQAMRRGELAHARKLVDESQTIHDRNGDRWGQAQTTGTLGAIARDAGNLSRAHELILLSANIAREAGGDWWEGGMLSELAMLALSAGRIDEAEIRARDSLTLAEASHDRSGRVFNVGVLATVAAGRGEAELAGRLWGAIEGEQAGAPLGGWRRHRQECEARIREVAGSDFDRGCVDGRDLPLETAVAIALEAARRHDGAG